MLPTHQNVPSLSALSDKLSAIPPKTRRSHTQPGAAIDVSRIEHDNLMSQVDRNARHVTRLERELADLRKEVSALRHLIERLTEKAS